MRSFWVVLICFFAIAVTMLFGCMSRIPGSDLSEPRALRNRTSLENGNSSCGLLYFKAPLFNVTGFLTAGVDTNSFISLFGTPETSFDICLHVVRSCPFLLEEPILDRRYFRFQGLPPGNYVAMVPRSAFPGNYQGLPLVHEFNRSNYSVKVNFYGGESEYSLFSFSSYPNPRTPNGFP